MLRQQTLIALAAMTLVAPGTICAQDARPNAYRRTPWHLVDTWWDVGRDHPFESYSVDVTISQPVPAESRLYIAPIGLGHLNNTPFYGGIQTQADGYSKANPRLRGIGPGFLMSMWGERSHSAIRPSAGGLFQSSGHEGDFVSVRRPFAWKAGTFTYKLIAMDKQVIDSKPYTWVGAFVLVHAENENVFVGALRFPGDKLVLGRQLANFVEIYGPTIPVDKIPRVTITFGNLKINGQPVVQPTARAVYPKGVPDFAEAKAQDGQLVIVVGRPVIKRTRRRQSLIPGVATPPSR
jgi:hypothetical protein